MGLYAKPKEVISWSNNYGKMCIACVQTSMRKRKYSEGELIMVAYKEMKVYETWDSTARRVFRNHGAAADCGACSINESRLLYSKREEALLRTDNPVIYRFDDGHNRSSWYLCKQNAEKSPKAIEWTTKYPDRVLDACLQSTTLQMDIVSRVKFPVFVELVSSCSRLCAYVNLHPEWDGAKARGIICFPDREVKSPVSGIIRADWVDCRNTYGFINGEMVPFGMVNIPDFLDYIWNNGYADAWADKKLFIMEHPSMGKFLYTEDNEVWIETASSRYAKQEINEPYQALLWQTKEDLEQYIVKETTLGQMMLEDSYSETELKTILGKFKEFDAAGQRLDGPWLPSRKHMAEIIEQGVSEGLLEKKYLRKYGITILSLCKTRLFKLASFTDNELSKMAEIYSNINQKASRQLRLS